MASRERFRIAYIVGAFPALSETFIVHQIVGMAARGHAVDIYTTTKEAAPVLHRDVERHGLTRRTHHIAPAGRLTGVMRALGLLPAQGWRAPTVVRHAFAEIGRSGFGGSLRLLYATLALIRRGRPRYDVIHAQFGQYGLLALQLKRVGAIDGAVVASFRGYDVGQYPRAHPGAYKDLFQAGTLFLPVSRTLAERLIETGCDPSRVQVHHSGISCRRLAYRDPNPSQAPLRLITVARLVEKKGVAYAIQAVARLLAAGRRVSYTIVGAGPLRAELESLVKQLGIGESVHLVGAKPHDDVLRLMNAADILIAPSVTAADGDTEGIPNVVKEAMAIGLPVVATRHGGIGELVEDGVSGFLVPERNDKALAERLHHLIDRPECWRAIARAGRAKVEAEFDSERLNVELEALYRRAVEESYVRGAGEGERLNHILGEGSAGRTERYAGLS